MTNLVWCAGVVAALLGVLPPAPAAHPAQGQASSADSPAASPTEEPSCSHQPATEPADVLPPVPRGPAPDWYRDLPQTVLEPRHLVLPIAYRVDAQGTVTSACVEAEVDSAVEASLRKALLSRRFEPAMAPRGPVAVLVRHEVELERRDRDPLPRQRLDDIRWLERAVEGQEAGVVAQRRLPPAERDSPALRRAAYARLGEIGSDDSLGSLARVEGRHVADITGSPTDDPLSIEIELDEVPIDGYPGAIRYGVDRQVAEGAGVSGGPYVSWRTSRPDDQTAIVTIRELHLRGRAPGQSGVSGTTDLIFLRHAVGRWVVVGYRRTWIN